MRRSARWPWDGSGDGRERNACGGRIRSSGGLGKQFADLAGEVIQHFILRPGVKVKTGVEIRAEISEGFDDGPQCAVKENCNVLKLRNAAFEAGESME